MSSEQVEQPATDSASNSHKDLSFTSGSTEQFLLKIENIHHPQIQAMKDLAQEMGDDVMSIHSCPTFLSISC
ncbi:unnamed protein product [Sympodiomycopsis kandeliae]